MAADYKKDTNYRTINTGGDPDKDPGWTVYRRQLVAESVTEKPFLLKTSQEEFAKLCSLKDTRPTKDKKIHEDFFRCSRKHGRGTAKRNCLGKLIFRFLKTRTYQ